MYSIEETIARNGSTKADIEGGSFQVVDGVRVPIFAGTAGEQIDAQSRLEHLRSELRAERISYGELIELQSLVKYIDPSDVELLEAAGVEEASLNNSLECPESRTEERRTELRAALDNLNVPANPRTLLESFAHVLGKHARYKLSEASMIACDLKLELQNYLSDEDIAAFFNMFDAAKKRHAF